MHRLPRYATRGCIGLDGWINCLRILPCSTACATRTNALPMFHGIVGLRNPSYPHADCGLPLCRLRLTVRRSRQAIRRTWHRSHWFAEARFPRAGDISQVKSIWHHASDARCRRSIIDTASLTLGILPIGEISDCPTHSCCWAD